MEAAEPAATVRGRVADVPAPGSASLIDAVDAANRPVGTVARADAFRAKANFRTVHVLVVNGRQEVLLQRLAASRERHPLRWGSSVAGYLHAGETYDDAARRRLREELDLNTALVRLGVTPMPDEGITKFIGVYTTSAETPTVADRDHIESIRFWRLPDLETAIRSAPEQFTESLRHVLSYWRQHASWSELT